MRKKYAAVVLGLTLSISQAGIFGAGLTVNAASEAAEDTEESTDTETQTDEERHLEMKIKKNRGLRKKEINKASPRKSRTASLPRGILEGSLPGWTAIRL